jgi:hypothetical protein
MTRALRGLAIALLLFGATPALAQSNASKPDEPEAAKADLAYAAFQRGQYLTAYAEATKRIEESKDPQAMTLVAELLANGLGVKRDEARAVHWYRLAAERGRPRGGLRPRADVSGGSRRRSAIAPRPRAVFAPRPISASPWPPIISLCSISKA